jgi:hypothetical protein
VFALDVSGLTTSLPEASADEVSGPGQSYSGYRTHEVQFDINPLVSTAWSKLLKELDPEKKGEGCGQREGDGAPWTTRPTCENREHQKTQQEAPPQVSRIFE